ncbi:MAG: amidohydrolase family protein [Bacteroidota bacterium]
MSLTKRFSVGLALAICLWGICSAQTYAFVNGRWFNGEAFESRTVYVADGVFVAAPPASIDSTYDLGGRYVVPPFGEAHNHNLDSDFRLQDRIRQYLLDGVFYAKMQSSIKRRIEPNRHLFNHPRTVDVAFAHAPLTGSGGHPVRLRERFFDMGRFDGLFESKSQIEGEGYIIIDSERDLRPAWTRVLALAPDFVKANLLYSEEFEERQADSLYFGQKGLNPDLLPYVVRWAHRDGLRVSVHVNTPTDFHYAIVAGVDEVNHLPFPRRGQATEERIRDEDALMASYQGTVVVTTVSLVRRNLEPEDEAWLEQAEATISDNLRILQAHGVTIAVGSDMFGDTSLDEAMYLHELEVFTNLELLKMWCENAPRTIFSERRIGQLADGYEASFLVLGGNPLEDFSQVKDIALRFKQGVDLARVLDAE